LVKKGELRKDDKTYWDSMAEVDNAEALAEQSFSKVLDIMNTMLELPMNIISERIDNISNSYIGLTAALNAGTLAMSGSQKTFAKMNDMLSVLDNSLFPRSRNDYINGGKNLFGQVLGAPTYLNQNKALMEDFNRQKLEVTELTQGALAAQELYNSLVASGTATEEQLKIAKDSMNEAFQKAEEGFASTAKAQSELIKNMVDNIDAYYNRLEEYVDRINDNIKSTIDYMTKSGNYQKNYNAISTGYEETIYNTRSRMTGLLNEIQVVQGQIQEGLGKTFDADDDEFIELGTTLRGLQGELINTASDLYDLYEAYYNLPNELATERINKLTTAFQNLNAAVSASATDTMATQRVLRDLAKQYGLVNKEQMNFALGETYVGQNAALMLQEQQETERLNILRDAYLKAEENVNKIRSGVPLGQQGSGSSRYDTPFDPYSVIYDVGEDEKEEDPFTTIVDEATDAKSDLINIMKDVKEATDTYEVAEPEDIFPTWSGSYSNEDAFAKKGLYPSWSGEYTYEDAYNHGKEIFIGLQDAGEEFGGVVASEVSDEIFSGLKDAGSIDVKDISKSIDLSDGLDHSVEKAGEAWDSAAKDLHAKTREVAESWKQTALTTEEALAKQEKALYSQTAAFDGTTSKVHETVESIQDYADALDLSGKIYANTQEQMNAATKARDEAEKALTEAVAEEAAKRV